MSLTEDACRWAYAKAMCNDHVRQALEDNGRAVYVDDVPSDGVEWPSIHRFVLARVALHGHGDEERVVTYCNGFAVA